MRSLWSIFITLSPALYALIFVGLPFKQQICDACWAKIPNTCFPSAKCKILNTMIFLYNSGFVLLTLPKRGAYKMLVNPGTHVGVVRICCWFSHCYLQPTHRGPLPYLEVSKPFPTSVPLPQTTLMVSSKTPPSSTVTIL